MKDIIFPITYKSDEKGLKVAESQLSGFGTIAAGAFAKIGAAAVEAFAQATRAAFDFGVESVKAASSFNETSAAVGQVFGEGSKQLEDFAATAAKSFGQSRTQALDAAKTFGIFGKAAGLSSQENVDFSKTLTTLASDLASFNNTSVDEAITSLGAALRGESEPIRRFGVLLDDATLKARAMQMGIYDGTGSLTQQQRVLAAYQEILAQTTVQQGDYIRTADGVANSSRSLEATFKDLQITVGQALLPAVEAVIPQLTAFIDEMVASPEFNQFIADMGANFSNLLGYLPSVLKNFGDLMIRLLPGLNPLMETFGSLVSIASTAMGGAASNSGKLWKELQLLADTISLINDLFTWADESISKVKITLGSGWSPFINAIVDSLNPLYTMIRNIVAALQALTGNKIAALNTLGVNTSSLTNIGARARGVRFATGGIVTQPIHNATVGEAGPEAIIPLDRFKQVTGIDGNGGGGATYNINVTAGMGTDGAALGEQIVNAIRRYERTSGAVFAKA